MKLFEKRKKGQRIFRTSGYLALLCSVGLVSCDNSTIQEQAIIVDLSTSPKSIEVNDDIEADCRMTLGSEITIVVTSSSESPCKWISADTSIAIVDQNKIKAVGIGETKITDENHPNHVINVIVTE